MRFLAHPDVGWISSMVPPLLKDWSEFDRLHFDPSHPWWQRYRRQLDVFVERGRGQMGHQPLHPHRRLELRLRAGRRHADLSEPRGMSGERPPGDRLRARPERARASRRSSRSCRCSQGGTFSNFAQWIPGRIVSESLDPFHMTSVAYFERWGREPAERILGTFDGGVIHIHGNGRHLLQAAATLSGLKAILLLDDQGFPRAFDVLGDLKARVGDVPVAVFADYPSFVERLAPPRLARRRHVPGEERARRRRRQPADGESARIPVVGGRQSRVRGAIIDEMSGARDRGPKGPRMRATEQSSAQ